MVLCLVGVGLGSLEDVTVRGLRWIEASSRVYLEAYTSVQAGLDAAALSARWPEKHVAEADRDFVESGCEEMLEAAREETVSFLVVGDPFGATTHADLVLRAHERGVPVEIVHNTSILTAVGCCGLQLYRFGQTVSVPFFEGDWRPSSFIEKIQQNLALDLHTLVLLDIKVKEVKPENMCRKHKIFEPPRFMTVNQAVDQLLHFGTLDGDQVRACGLARVGTSSQQIKFGTLNELRTHDFGAPLHSLVICAPSLHEIEQAFARHYA